MKNSLIHQNQFMKIILIACLIISPVFGQSYFKGMGFKQSTVYDGRSGGMGLARTALSQGAWSLSGNPAQLRSVDGLQVSAGMILDQISEERSIEAIDQFNDVVTKNIYAANTHAFRKYALSAAYGSGNYVVGFTTVPIMDVSYKYREEIRNSLSSSYYNRDPLAGYHTMDMQGQVMAHHFGGSASFGKFSLGAGMVTYGTDELTYDRSVSVIESDDALASDTSFADLSTLTLSESGIGYLVGLSYELNNDFSIHYTMDKQGDLTIESSAWIPLADSSKRYPEYLSLDSSAAFTIETPVAHRFGIAFSPGQKNKTIAVFELELHKAQTITYSREIGGASSFDYDLMDSRIIHVGLEHWASPTLPVRMGYSYEESPMDRSLSLTRFTVGGSILYGPFRVDLAGQMASLGYVYPDIFPAAGATALSESVNESVLSLFATATYQIP